ncbi:MAG: transposase [Candidatus Endonucleobacter bathymodioli]|uniref:Transposase n=1 Tax=Candidatus Endonucleibacter bathymodioli TaxID=539814 RepID=A0AA90SSU7_9GAMM|nr:transposase [Candidatus Endonucleobacter bathymodioli]
MLRTHCIQQCYTTGYHALEYALHDTDHALFVDLSLNRTIPDHTTIMNFHHLLERHDNEHGTVNLRIYLN